MERTPDETTPTLERLAEQVRALERRVHLLEVRSPAEPSAAVAFPASPTAGLPAAAPAVSPPPALDLPAGVSAGLMPVLGTAILGIAGAYLLRAATESGKFPAVLGVAASAVYAAVWLFGSATKRPGRDLPRAIYAPTAALILFPMLWETTVQFKVLAPAAAAALLVAFVAMGAALAWSRDRILLVSVAALPAAATALVLTVATGELLPFTAALLAIGVIVEAGGLFGRWAALRPWLAMLADLGVWLTVYVAGLPQQPESYRPAGHLPSMGMCVALMAIYATSVGARTAGQRRPIALFETVQMAAACGLAVWGVLRLSQEATALGAACLLGAAALYLAAFLRFRDAAMRRNHRVYTSLALALALAGGALALPSAAAALLWAALAVATVFVAGRLASVTLAIHGAIYLMAAAFLSGLLLYAGAAMTAGRLPPAPPLLVWLTGAAAVLVYLTCSSGPAARGIRFVAASLAALTALAFLLVMIGLAAGSPSGPWLPTARTLLVCTAALLAAVAGARAPSHARAEFTWMGYALMALVTVKLFYEDFHESPPAALAVSLVGYGAVLIFGPRLTRAKASSTAKQATPEPTTGGANRGT